MVIDAAAADQMLATDNAVEATAGRAAFEEQQHAAAARTASKALSRGDDGEGDGEGRCDARSGGGEGEEQICR